MPEAMEVGRWAQEKLECLRKYLSAYTTILDKKIREGKFKGSFYIDAFAGPGLLKIRAGEAGFFGPELARYVDGSPRVALGLRKPFKKYVFIEREPERAQELRKLSSEYPHLADRIIVCTKDCNEYLRELLVRNAGRWDRWRGVVFLDPFGMQVPWKTLKGLGRTRAIEVFINFPVGMAIQRLLRRDGSFSGEARQRLDDYFGTPEWYDTVYKETPGFFGPTVKKTAEPGKALVRWYRDRLKRCFRFVTSARLIRGTRGNHLYYLIHAGPNETGSKIAEYVLSQGEVH